MANSLLIPLNDSIASRTVVDFLINMSLDPVGCHISLIHVFRKPTSGEELMGKKFMDEQPAKFNALLENAKQRLIFEKGFKPDQVTVQLLTEPYPSVTEGIIDFFQKGQYDMVVIGRKKMSKSEEFIMGDISVKLVRSLDKTSILVVKHG
ncbi:MAG: universal stress protein [Desulfobacteraceae bacterium]|nr:universal stress protein [Desulfobacteraceae bacterium]